MILRVQNVTTTRRSTSDCHVLQSVNIRFKQQTEIANANRIAHHKRNQKHNLPNHLWTRELRRKTGILDSSGICSSREVPRWRWRRPTPGWPRLSCPWWLAPSRCSHRRELHKRPQVRGKPVTFVTLSRPRPVIVITKRLTLWGCKLFLFHL